MPGKKRQILTGVEIGTSTIKVVMGEMLAHDVISVVGMGTAPALRVVKGEVCDVNVVQEQLERALAMAEQASGMDITDIFLAISGAHVHTVNSIGSTIVSSPDRRIGEDDVVAAARNAHAYNIPPDRKVLHYFDRYYRVDGTREVINPLGLVGTKLEADVHIVYGQHNRIETNCSMIAEVVGYPATDVAFSCVAAGLAAFSPEETEKGALLIDIGAGVTEYAVFQGTGCFHSGQVTVGCEHIVNDLALGLRLPAPKCRKILHDLGDFGSAAMDPDGRARLMAVETLPQVTRHIPVSTIEQVIELRVQELMDVILADLRTHDALARIGRGAFLCGGGARVPGIDRLARHVLQMPVSIAKPRLFSGEQDLLDSPEYVAPVGLLRWGKLMLEIGPNTGKSFWDQLWAEAARLLKLVWKSFHW